MERCGEMKFWYQMRLGFNLCVVPPRDHGVPISEGQEFGNGKGKNKSTGGY